MGEKYRDVKTWRRTAKKRLREAFGGKCGICGYDKYEGNLVLHHIDPSLKDFTISRRIKSWKSIVAEAKKCVMLCHNCHNEVHAGLASIDGCPHFDPQYEEYGQINAPKLLHITADQLLDVLRSAGTWRGAGKILNVADVTVRKRAQNLGINTSAICGGRGGFLRIEKLVGKG